MKFKEIPEAIREARTALVERWLRASSPEERHRIIESAIKSAPKSSVIPRAIARLWPDARETHARETHSKAIHAKEIEIASLSRQLSDTRARLNALVSETEAVKGRVIALKQREEQLIHDQATAPQLAIDIAASLGFGREEILNREAKQPKPK